MTFEEQLDNYITYDYREDMEEIKMEQKCLKCNYAWISIVEMPKQCPACKSYRWRKEK